MAPQKKPYSKSTIKAMPFRLQKIREPFIKSVSISVRKHGTLISGWWSNSWYHLVRFDGTALPIYNLSVFRLYFKFVI